MGKIPNAVEVFGTPTFASSPWMALQPTLFEQVKANQPSMFCVATGAANPLVLACIAFGGVVDPDHRDFELCSDGLHQAHDYAHRPRRVADVPEIKN